MPVFEREVRVSAPLEDVWEFHATADGLVALTPDWMHLRVEETRGPDGEPDPEVLEPGAVVVSSIQPFGVGPRQRWVSEIVVRAAGDLATIVHDRVAYELPGGSLGELAGPLGFVGMEPMFRFRHRKTKELLEA